MFLILILEEFNLVKEDKRVSALNVDVLGAVSVGLAARIWAPCRQTWARQPPRFI